MTPADVLLREGTDLLRTAGIDEPRREARLLLAHASGLTATELLTDPARTVDPAPVRAALARRAAREPLALITGVQEFWSLPFTVSPVTLLPRADSETVVEAALALPPPGRVLDLGTGTGCLLLAVLSERPMAWGLGLDRVPEAAALARRNARALGLASRSEFVVADWTSPLVTPLAGRFDLVLSNPPYIPHADMGGLMPEVARWEPGTALDGGPDGLDAYRRIFASLPRLLAPSGHAVLEAGAGQAASILALAEAAGLRALGTRRDLSGTERACIVQSR